MIFHNHRPIPYYTFGSFDPPAVSSATRHPQPAPVLPDRYPAPRPAPLRHAVLTRLGGISPAPWDSLNLGWTVGDERENVEANYCRWSQAFGLVREELTTTWQVHGNRILVADEHRRGGSLGQADGLITRIPGLAITQRFADCTPIFLYDPVQQACGIAHAGWQGTVARCAEAAVQAMQSHFGSQPADLLAGIGPAIGPCCYEVGPEVADAVRTSHRRPDLLLTSGHRDNRYILDLWQANAQQLSDAGVLQIEIAGLCTACHRDVFFSHRADKGRSGRFGAFMMLADEGAAS